MLNTCESCSTHVNMSNLNDIQYPMKSNDSPGVIHEHPCLFNWEVLIRRIVPCPSQSIEAIIIIIIIIIIVWGFNCQPSESISKKWINIPPGNIARVISEPHDLDMKHKHKGDPPANSDSHPRNSSNPMLGNVNKCDVVGGHWKDETMNAWCLSMPSFPLANPPLQRPASPRSRWEFSLRPASPHSRWEFSLRPASPHSRWEFSLRPASPHSQWESSLSRPLSPPHHLGQGQRAFPVDPASQQVPLNKHPPTSHKLRKRKSLLNLWNPTISRNAYLYNIQNMLMRYVFKYTEQNDLDRKCFQLCLWGWCPGRVLLLILGRQFFFHSSR